MKLQSTLTCFLLFMFIDIFIAQNSYSPASDSLVINDLIKQIKSNQQKNPFESLLLIDKLESYSRAHNNFRGIALAIKERAHFLYNKQKYNEALSEINQIDSFSNYLSTLEQARLYNLKGVIFQAMEKIDSSLYYFNKSINLYKKTRNHEGIITALTNIGISFYQAGLNREALNHFEKAYQISLKYKDFKNLNAIINNYAILLLTNDQPQKAKELFSSLLQNKDLEKNTGQKAILLLNWATLLKTLGQNNESIEGYQKALEYSKLHNLPVSPEIYIGLGQAWLASNKPETSIKSFKKALTLNPPFSDKKMIYKGLAQSYLKINQIDSAQAYWNRLLGMIEKNQQNEIKKALTDAQKNLEDYKKDFEIQMLAKDNQILEQKNKVNNLIILSLLLLVLLISSIIYWYRKQQQYKEKQLLEEMKLKKQSLLTYSLKMAQKNKLLSDLINKLKQDKTSNKENDMLRKEIINTINHSLQNDKDWEQFEIYFNDIYQGFYDRLKEKYPDLTENDLRVCSLVKLRFSIKEISNMLFLSPETIKSTRYRIRKKLNLAPDERLSDFLNKI